MKIGSEKPIRLHLLVDKTKDSFHFSSILMRFSTYK